MWREKFIEFLSMWIWMYKILGNKIFFKREKHNLLIQVVENLQKRMNSCEGSRKYRKKEKRDIKSHRRKRDIARYQTFHEFKSCQVVLDDAFYF